MNERNCYECHWYYKNKENKKGCEGGEDGICDDYSPEDEYQEESGR